jgi:hypothetical protein
MDKVRLLQDLKDDCRSVGWDGYIPAIEALEAENAALKAQMRKSNQGPAYQDCRCGQRAWCEASCTRAEEATRARLERAKR